MSCPHIKYTSPVHGSCVDDGPPQEMYPRTDSWNAIVRQYSSTPVGGVGLEIKNDQDSIITCSIGFLSNCGTFIELCFRVIAAGDEEEDRIGFQYLAEIYCEVFSQASRIIRDHPLLGNNMCLHISHISLPIGLTGVMRIAKEIGRLFSSVGPLGELNINRCDIRPYFASFLDLQEFYDSEHLVAFPPIQELTISHPLCISCKDFATAVVGLAK